MSTKDWTSKMTNKQSAASEFLKPFDSNIQQVSDNKSNVNENVNNNINANDNESEKSELSSDSSDFLDNLLEDPKTKKTELTLTGLYLEPDLAKLLDKLGKKGGRGAKSKIANDALRIYFSEKGLL